MKSIFDIYEKLWSTFLQIFANADSLPYFIARIILFLIVIFLSLVILGFTGFLENPIGL